MIGGIGEKKSGWSEFQKGVREEGEVGDRLRVQIEEGGDLERIVDGLFIDGNRLGYGLEKIEELRGKEGGDVKELMEVYMGEVMNELC